MNPVFILAPRESIVFQMSDSLSKTASWDKEEWKLKYLKTDEHDWCDEKYLQHIKMNSVFYKMQWATDIFGQW